MYNRSAVRANAAIKRGLYGKGWNPNRLSGANTARTKYNNRLGGKGGRGGGGGADHA